jgi:hypothetical protein
MTEQRTASIPGPELARVTCDMLDAIRVLPSLRALTRAQAVLVQAYMLGIFLRAAGLEVEDWQKLEGPIAAGYSDYSEVEPDDEGDSE